MSLRERMYEYAGYEEAETAESATTTASLVSDSVLVGLLVPWLWAIGRSYKVSAWKTRTSTKVMAERITLVQWTQGMPPVATM